MRTEPDEDQNSKPESRQKLNYISMNKRVGTSYAAKRSQIKNIRNF